MKYYIISAEDAQKLGLHTFRHGNRKGYVVNASDLEHTEKGRETEAREVTEQEAIKFINEL